MRLQAAAGVQISGASRFFDIVFRTWGDTRVARVRVAWIALGAVANDDGWDV